MQESKSILARLLANENITIQYGSFKTAWFDIEKRVLGIPVLKDEYGKDTHDLFIGHEVGHALNTPADGWHESPKQFNVPRSFLNVCEDIRIERKVQEKYPGLKASFKRGYKRLFDENFFHTAGRDIQKYSLIDRLNLKSKLRDLIDVQFSAEEMPYIKAAYQADTWDEVVNAAKAIYDFMAQQKKENQNKSDQDQSESNSNLDQPESNSDDNFEENPEQNEFSGSTDSDVEDSHECESSSNGESEDNPNTEVVEDIESDSDETIQTTSVPDFEAETDIAFRDNESNIVHTVSENGEHMHLRGFSKNNVKEVIFPYSKIRDARKINEYSVKNNEPYLEFTNKTKNFVSVLAKEFEMRKAAYRSIRAKESQSGSLNVNKLYSYKYNEDIFNRFTTLADAKSHGMVMFIDYSGSMGKIIKKTIQQVLILAKFCKKVNIPFQVYGFTSNRYAYSNLYAFRDSNSSKSIGDTVTENLILLDLLNSDMNNRTFKEAYEGLYYSNNHGPESLGYTPLIETLFCAEKIIADFKKKHGVQKVNMVILSDGAPSDVSVYGNGPQIASWRSSKITGELNGQIIEADNTYVFYKKCISSFSNVGVNTIGFFLANDYRDIQSLLTIDREYKFMINIWEKSKELFKKLSNDKTYVIDNFLGYNRMIILSAKNKDLSVDSDDLEINANASKGKIITAFKKYSLSKKVNKVLATKFAEAIS